MTDSIESLYEALTKLPLTNLQCLELSENVSFHRISLQRSDLKESRHSELDFEESILDQVELDAVRWDKLDFREVAIETCSLANSRCCDGNWENVLCRKSRLTGVNFSGSQLDRVRFEGCKLDLSVWHETKPSKCEFHRCNLREADFQGAKLQDCVFRNCDLRGARFLAAKFERIDFRGSHLAGMLLDPATLPNTIIDPGQLLEFATLLGLDVRTLEPGEN